MDHIGFSNEVYEKQRESVSTSYALQRYRQFGRKHL